MAMPHSARRYTADDLADLPDDGNRYEVIDGVLLVTPAPLLLHQRAQMQLIALLQPYAESIGLELFAAPTAVRASDITELQPDLLAYRPARRDLESERWVPMPSLALAVEILSPSTRHRDRGIKRQTYLDLGVAEYWTVDPEARAVDVWRPAETAPEARRDALVWRPVAGREPLVIDLRRFFVRVFQRQ